jgi:FAD/FMN-containing dehydrogenase
LPYPPIQPEAINLAPLIAGSEGTLAVVGRAKVRLVQKPRHTILGVLSFSSIVEACEAVPGLLTHEPSAVELIPQSLIQLARSVPAYASLTKFVDNLKVEGQDPAALLVVEFSDNEPDRLVNQLAKLNQKMWVASSAEHQKMVWDVRKVGLGILMSRPGDVKPVAFIEDTAVPVNRLGEFVREMEKILAEYGTTADFYAHASAGCLHIRPLLSLKTAKGVANLRSIAEQTVALTLHLGGAVSAEHGDGQARGEWLKNAYGEQILEAFARLKASADPKGLLNPGKIVNPSRMDVNLRYGEEYKPEGWKPIFHYSTSDPAGGVGTAEAIEQCNGRSMPEAEGAMCPSSRSLREMHTHAKGKLERAYIRVFPF